MRSLIAPSVTCNTGQMFVRTDHLSPQIKEEERLEADREQLTKQKTAALKTTEARVDCSAKALSDWE